MVIFLLPSCEDIFHESDNGYLVLDADKERIEMLNAIYFLLSNVHNSHYLVALCRSDDVNLYYSNYSFDGCSSSGTQGSYAIHSVTNNIYKKLYTAILNTNNLIQKTDASQYSEMLGEIYFLRAYCYFKLARLFGTPPLVKDIDVNYNLRKPNYTEVYEFIESDLLKALDLLPENAAKARVINETPNKNTCKALMAEFYLSWAGYPINNEQQYHQVVNYANTIIENSTYALENELSNLWRENNIYNSECVFGLFNHFENTYEEIESLYFDGPIMNKYGGVYVTSSSFHEFQGEAFPKYFSYYSPDFYYYTNYPNNNRKEVFFNTGYYRSFQITMPNEIITGTKYHRYNPIKDACEYIKNVQCLKGIDVIGLNDSSKYEQTPQAPLHILRYAQTLLTYAEAKARIGELDASAFNAVNMIRRRANGLDLYSPSEYDLQPNLTASQFIDSVVRERSYELCYEPEGRWFDIIRLDLKDKLEEFQLKGDKVYTVADKYLNEDWYFYLIPQEDRWLNPNYEVNDN